MLGRTPPTARSLRAWDAALAVSVAFTVQFWHLGVGWLLGLGMAAALLFRRRRPLLVMIVVSALALAQQLLATVPDEPLADATALYDVAVLIAMVTVVSHTERMWQALAAGALVLLGVLLLYRDSLSLTSPSGRDSLLEAASFMVLSAGLWLTAYVLRTRRLYVAALEERAEVVEREQEHLARLAAAEERAEIARDLHDVVAHSLSVMILQADGASYAIEKDSDKAQRAVRTIADTGREALEDMHHIVKVLRGGSGYGGEDRRTVDLNELGPLVERARVAGLDVRLDAAKKPAGLPGTAEVALFRIVQEGLTNVLRHAGPAARVAVTLRFDQDLATLEIVDDGPTGEPVGPSHAMLASGGNGLRGMREQLEAHGGRFSAGPRPDTGWRITAELPLAQRVTTT
ncbi:histidine kinase [Streptomyces sp. NPDC049916]|uniref:sensor histidine kinase n=1 Tax=Streptomyces sp. NPDC049916 TaxID=3155156 RepID=UPI0034482600